MVESILKGLKALPELSGPLQASIWDQGDAVGAWLGKKLVAVVFPTPETLPQVSISLHAGLVNRCYTDMLHYHKLARSVSRRLLSVGILIMSNIQSISFASNITLLL